MKISLEVNLVGYRFFAFHACEEMFCKFGISDFLQIPGGGHAKSSTQLDSARAPTPYPFMYHLWTEKVLSRIPYIDKFVPFHRPTIRDKSC